MEVHRIRLFVRNGWILSKKIEMAVLLCIVFMVLDGKSNWMCLFFSLNFYFVLDRLFSSPWRYAKRECLNRNRLILFVHVVAVHLMLNNSNFFRIINQIIVLLTNVVAVRLCNLLALSYFFIWKKKTKIFDNKYLILIKW